MAWRRAPKESSSETEAESGSGKKSAVVRLLVPFVLTAGLVAGGVWLWLERPPERSEDGVWSGPPMPGKAQLLPAQPEALANLTAPKESAQEPEFKTTKTESLPLPPVAAPASPAAPSVVEVKVPPPPPPAASAVADAKPAIKAVAVTPAKPTGEVESLVGGGFTVQAGSFVLQGGAETLQRQLNSYGFQTQIVKRKETLLFNGVQAGPFKTVDQAKESQIKLRAAGLRSTIEQTAEGWVIPVSQSLLLSTAVQDMERVEELSIRPLRLVKVDALQEVYKVVLGPYPSHDKAKEISGKLSHVGVGAPLIRAN
ncbi:MAG: SPOR domain-containing protein [Magnetococcales bacterium]|nr:SPOR domain-containing protein [Magnetococcales bacterium]